MEIFFRLVRLCGINKLLPDVQNSEDGGGGGGGGNNNNSNGDNRRASAAAAANAVNNNANNTVIAACADSNGSPKVIVAHKDECRNHQNGRASSVISEDKVKKEKTPSHDPKSYQ